MGSRDERVKEVLHRCRVLRATKKEGAAVEIAEVLSAASFETADLPSARRRLEDHVNPNEVLEPGSLCIRLLPLYRTLVWGTGGLKFPAFSTHLYIKYAWFLGDHLAIKQPFSFKVLILHHISLLLPSRIPSK